MLDASWVVVAAIANGGGGVYPPPGSSVSVFISPYQSLSVPICTRITQHTASYIHGQYAAPYILPGIAPLAQSVPDDLSIPMPHWAVLCCAATCGAMLHHADACCVWPTDTLEPCCAETALLCACCHFLQLGQTKQFIASVLPLVQVGAGDDTPTSCIRIFVFVCVYVLRMTSLNLVCAMWRHSLHVRSLSWAPPLPALHGLKPVAHSTRI